MDGNILLFTDHDCPLTFNYVWAKSFALTPGSPSTGSDETYTPIDSVTASARQRQSGVKDHNVDVTGVITSDKITEADLRAGRYRECKVVEMLVDWKFPYAGYLAHTTYYILQTTFSRELWQAQISGVPIWLRKEVGEVYSQGCRFELGDSRCQVTLGTYTASGSVTSIVDANRIFNGNGLNPTTDYYTDGVLTWTSGPNMGLKFDVKSSNGTQIELQLETDFAIGLGDTYSVVAGCDHLRGTCSGKFNNLVNFGGFPFLPGNDQMIRGPI